MLSSRETRLDTIVFRHWYHVTTSFDVKKGLDETQQGLSDANQILVAMFLVQFDQPMLMQKLVRNDRTGRRDWVDSEARKNGTARSYIESWIFFFSFPSLSFQRPTGHLII